MASYGDYSKLGEGVRSPTSPEQYIPCGQMSCQGTVYSMCVIPNKEGEMFIVTWDPHRLIHTNAHGTVIKSVDLPHTPCDLCMYGSSVAATIPDNKQLICYRTSDLGVDTTINLPDRCYGVCRVQDMFVISFQDEGVVRCVNDSGQIIRSSSDELLRDPTFVRFSEPANCILISDWRADEVVALSVDLTTVLFKMSHTDLQLPRGLCINEDGGVYVCSFKKCVVEFTKEGKYKSTILPADQLEKTYPHSICYDGGNRCLYVAADLSNVIRAYKGQ